MPRTAEEAATGLQYLLVAHPCHHGHHGLAQQDDAEQAISLGQMRSVMRHLDEMTGGHERCAEVDSQRECPEPEALWRRDETRDQPEQRCDR